MEEFGFARDNICVFDYYNADAFRNLEIDIVYISGGNTFATIDRIRKCEFDREIIRYTKLKTFSNDLPNWHFFERLSENNVRIPEKLRLIG